MELEEAKNKLQEMIGLCTEEPKHITYNEEQAIEVILNHLTKQKKMIELMANFIYHIGHYEDSYGNSCAIIQDSCFKNKTTESCEQCIKQYFEKKVEESKQMINNIKDIEQICKQIDELSFEELQNAMEKADAELQKEEGE